MKSVTLNNGVEIPIQGYGVFRMTDPQEIGRCAVDAIVSGYRSIYTAASNVNDEVVSTGVRSRRVRPNTCSSQPSYGYRTPSTWHSHQVAFQIVAKAAVALLQQ